MPTILRVDTTDGLSPAPLARVAEKGHAQYWTVEEGRVLVGGTLADVVQAMSRPRLSIGHLSAVATNKVSIWTTPFEGVHRLTFGHELRMTPSGPQVYRWFRPEDGPTTSEDPVETMRRAISEAIVEATSGETGATVALSGGLDSTVLLALAAQEPHVRGGLQAYCATPDLAGAIDVPGRRADEWPDAEAVAGFVGVPAHRLAADGFNWLNVTDDFHARLMSPVLAVPNLWWLRRLEHLAVSNGHRVILAGQSGNATFSHGRIVNMSPLLADGTRVQPAQRKRKRLAITRWSQRLPTSAVVGGFKVQIPQHVLELDPWTRWCLAEPPAPGHGPWTGADVVWKDPLGSAEVITAAMSLPQAAWGDSVSSRRLARAVGAGLIPDHVRLSRVRGVQGTDVAGVLRRHAADYAVAVDRVGESASAREFLDMGVLRRGLRLLEGDLKSAHVFRQHYLKPLTVGLFAAWWDGIQDRVGASRAESAPTRRGEGSSWRER